MTSQKDVLPIASNKPFWLASASSPRVQLLKQIGFTPARVLESDIDETPLNKETPQAFTTRLAHAKGNKPEAPDATVVLAADTVIAVGRRILSKPPDRDTAAQYLRLLSGRGHRVYSSVWVRAHPNPPRTRCVVSRVKMKHLSDNEINDYLESDEWHSCAGGYAIQGLGGAFIHAIIGSYSNIVGLPLYETAAMLRGVGVVPQTS